MENTVGNLRIDSNLSTVYASSRWLYPLEGTDQFIAGDLNLYRNIDGQAQPEVIDTIVVSSDMVNTAKISAVTQTQYDAGDKDPSTLYIITADI